MPEFTRCEILDGPDREDKYTYFLFWMADYQPGHPQGEYRRVERGQIFHAPLPKGPEYLTMQIVDRRRA